MEKQDEKNIRNAGGGRQAQTQKERIIQKLKEKGSRMTKQRLMLLNIILEDEYSCCKEIYFKAAEKDDKISPATVYRMVNTLEEIGAISRNNIYRVACGKSCEYVEAYEVELDDGTVIDLEAERWHEVVRAGLRECGYLEGRDLSSVRIKSCAFREA